MTVETCTRSLIPIGDTLNILSGYGIKTIVTACLHCFYTLKMNTLNRVVIMKSFILPNYYSSLLMKGR
ncbi:MAG: hypothetical protein ACM3H8_11725 [Sphingobacteriales bacterium]